MLLHVFVYIQIIGSTLLWWGDTLKVTFLGDIMQHQSQMDAAIKNGGNTNDSKSYDYSTYYKHLQKLFEKSDLRIANMETTFSSPPYSGYPVFNSPVSLLEASKSGGIDIFLSANNHICDKGGKGIESTISAYNALRVPFIGAYRSKDEREQLYPLIVELKGVRMAILNYTYGTNGIPVPQPYVVNKLDSVQIKEDILKAKKSNVHFIIACIHWGIEYKLDSSVEQKRWKRFFNTNGVNIMIGSHPHVVQEVEVKKELSGEVKRVTAYSLGNAISNMTAPYTRTGMVFTLQIVREISGQIRLIEPEYELIWTSRPNAVENNFTILPIKEFIDSSQLFKNKDEWHKMKNEYSKLQR